MWYRRKCGACFVERYERRWFSGRGCVGLKWTDGPDLSIPYAANARTGTMTPSRLATRASSCDWPWAYRPRVSGGGDDAVLYLLVPLRLRCDRPLSTPQYMSRTRMSVL